MKVWNFSKKNDLIFQEIHSRFRDALLAVVLASTSIWNSSAPAAPAACSCNGPVPSPTGSALRNALTTVTQIFWNFWILHPFVTHLSLSQVNVTDSTLGDFGFDMNRRFLPQRADIWASVTSQGRLSFRMTARWEESDAQLRKTEAGAASILPNAFRGFGGRDLWVCSIQVRFAEIPTFCQLGIDWLIDRDPSHTYLCQRGTGKYPTAFY